MSDLATDMEWSTVFDAYVDQFIERARHADDAAAKFLVLDLLQEFGHRCEVRGGNRVARRLINAAENTIGSE